MNRALRRDASIVRSVRGRVRALVASWPAAIAVDVRASHACDQRPRPYASYRVPYWYHLPLCAGRRRALPRAMLEDVLFAQHCLALAVRVQDDCFDSQGEPGAGVFAPTLLILAAQEALRRRFPSRSSFWPQQRRLLTTSLRAIARIAAIQTNSGPLQRGVRMLYAHQNCVLKVGLLAVCHGDLRSGLYRTLSVCADHLAVAGQLLDDLEDIQTDRSRGKTNAAASFFTRHGPSGRRPQGNTMAATARAIQRYLALPKKELHAADRLLASLHLTSARVYIDQSLAVIGRWEDMLRRADTLLPHSQRVQKVKP